MNICFVTNKYPNRVDVNGIVFLQQLIVEMARKGEHCTVICPVPVNLNLRYRSLPEHVEERYNDSTVDVYYPRYFGLGQKNYGKFNPARITTHFFTSAINKLIKKEKLTFNAIYGHFVTPAGIATARIGRELGIPSFLAYGEATYGTIEHFGKRKVKRELANLSGVIAVSAQNKKMIEYFVKPNITQVFPNAIDNTVFFPRDRKKSREELGLNHDDFIVSFVGSFDERKGINRLVDAIDKLGGNVKLIAAGKGSLVPSSNNCLIQRTISHEQLPIFLSASDIFVLPTRNEGCCNAIVEAMACGLPIVSANREFNFDILTADNAILIDPDSVDEIKCGIETLLNDCNLRKKMANASVKRSQEFTLQKRADNIIAFVKKSVR